MSLAEMAMYAEQIVDDIDIDLGYSPSARPGGSLLIMVGLPGVGKSSVVESLKKFMPIIVISTDGVRTYVRQSPVYTAAEMALVYEVCYSLIERRLRQGQRVIFDASNNLQARRDYLARLAERCGAPVTTCSVQASQDVIQQRLYQRINGGRRKTDMSDADWTVYKWMVETQEPVVGPHLIVDTTSTPPDVLAKRLYHYWLESEANAQNNPDLQSPRWASKLSFND
ncbi:MAG: ATP-binding protein [Ardenticatenaceae bacterium]|nr:ATP-binding protein [Ardenticatenaceae bacterium]